MKNKNIYGMVHLLALPGSAKYGGEMNEIVNKALQDAENLVQGGVDGIIVENDGDQPYSIKLDIEQSVALASIAAILKNKHPEIQFGISAAFNDYEAGIAIANAINADFVRLPVFVDTVVCFNGIITPCCHNALKYRKKIRADKVKIFADVQVKHTHMLLNSISLEESVKLAQSCGADAVIVTGESTGMETPIDIVKRAKEVASIPIIIGSGTTRENVKNHLEIADGAIVGTYFKTNGYIDKLKVKKLMEVIQE